MPFNNGNNGSSLNLPNASLFPTSDNYGMITHISNANNLQSGLGFSNNLSDSMLSSSHPPGENLLNSAAALAAEKTFCICWERKAERAVEVSAAMIQGEILGDILSSALSPDLNIDLSDIDFDESLSPEEEDQNGNIQHSVGNAGMPGSFSDNNYLNMIMISAAGTAIGAGGIYIFGAKGWKLIKPIIASTVSRLNESLSE
jgi:hypothetical protein